MSSAACLSGPVALPTLTGFCACCKFVGGNWTGFERGGGGEDFGVGKFLCPRGWFSALVFLKVVSKHVCFLTRGGDSGVCSFEFGVI